MATDLSFVEFVHAQTGLGAALSFRKMFGEYAYYLDAKVVAFACDNQLYLKPTDAGRAVLGTVSEHPPYPGGKPHFRLDDEIDDPARLQRLFTVTADALPASKPKVKPKPKPKPPSDAGAAIGPRATATANAKTAGAARPAGAAAKRRSGPAKG